MTLRTAPWIVLAIYVGWLARDVYSVWRDAQRQIEQAKRDAARRSNS
jgi:hypothetical protein